MAENVTVELRNYDETPAVFFTKGFGDFFLIEGASDTLALREQIYKQSRLTSLPLWVLAVMVISRRWSVTFSAMTLPKQPFNYGATAVTRAMTLTVDGVTHEPLSTA